MTTPPANRQSENSLGEHRIKHQHMSMQMGFDAIPENRIWRRSPDLFYGIAVQPRRFNAMVAPAPASITTATTAMAPAPAPAFDSLPLPVPASEAVALPDGLLLGCAFGLVYTESVKEFL